MSIRNKKTLSKMLGAFFRQYSRKKHAGQDPNDRGYDRKIEKNLKNMDPVELDALLRGEEDGEE